MAALTGAILRNDVDAVSQYVDSSYDVTLTDSFGATPLHLAAAYSAVDILTLVARRSPDVDVRDKDGRTPLMYACWTGRLDNAQALVGLGADVSATSRSSSALHEAAWWGHADVVRWLVAEHRRDEGATSSSVGGAGVNVNAKSAYWRQTALHKASCQGNVDVARVLLDAGARAKARDRYWKTPLDYSTNEHMNELLKHAKSNIAHRFMSRCAKLRHGH